MMELSTGVNIILAILSFLLALTSVITIIITIKQNNKILKHNEQQLEEMREEHRLSTQPILTLENEVFYIARPQFYYTPPENTYDFLSVYQYEAQVKNISSATAICIDISAYIIIETENYELTLDTVSIRYNVLSSNSISDTMMIRFVNDTRYCLYDALREKKASKLPKLRIKMIYKNTCGGYFSCEKTMILIPSDDDSQNIKTWHTCMIGASVKEREAIDTMKKMYNKSDWGELFESSKKNFDEELGNPDLKKISIQLAELPQKYDFASITKEEFQEEISRHGYSRYIHKNAECVSENERNS